jgi:hypothetical protein
MSFVNVGGGTDWGVGEVGVKHDENEVGHDRDEVGFPHVADDVE